jgi:hypothetical protein
MKRLAIAQLNSADAINDEEFAKRVAEMAIRKIVPFALREAAKVHPDQFHKDALEVAAKTCEIDGTYAANAAANAAAHAAAYAAVNAANAADNAAAYAAAYAAANAAVNAANAANAADNAANAATAAAHAAAYAAKAAAYAATAAAYAAVNVANAADNAANAADNAVARDKFLAFVAEEVVQILIDMNAPCTAWLDLAPIQNAA